MEAVGEVSPVVDKVSNHYNTVTVAGVEADPTVLITFGIQ